MKPNEIYIRSDRAPVESYYDKQSELHVSLSAELASSELRDAIQSAFERFARRRGITPNDARILLMGGVPIRPFMLGGTR